MHLLHLLQKQLDCRRLPFKFTPSIILKQKHTGFMRYDRKPYNQQIWTVLKSGFLPLFKNLLSDFLHGWYRLVMHLAKYIFKTRQLSQRSRATRVSAQKDRIVVYDVDQFVLLQILVQTTERSFQRYVTPRKSWTYFIVKRCLTSSNRGCSEL